MARRSLWLTTQKLFKAESRGIRWAFVPWKFIFHLRRSPSGEIYPVERGAAHADVSFTKRARASAGALTFANDFEIEQGEI